MADVAMSWPSKNGGSMRMAVSQFPPLNVCERDVRRGAVKVIARSPSGRTQTLKIKADSSGQFTTDFTPNAVGQCIKRLIVLTPTAQALNQPQFFGVSKGILGGKEQI